jgi:phage tail sheath protein FI
MAEALISPGVFLRENDLSQITAGPITVGAALVGPTVVGQPNIPTLVTSYSKYKAVFGTTFISGGNTHEYMTSQAAYNYFQQGGTSLLVTRVASGSYTPATASVVTPGTVASVQVTSTFANGAFFQLTGSTVGQFFVTSSTTQVDAAPIYYVTYSATPATQTSNIVQKVNSLVSTFGIVATASSTTASFFATASSTVGNSYSYVSASTTQTFGGGTTPFAAFALETLSVGTVMNNNQGATTAVNGVLPSGSANNVRWQVTQADTASGYFTLLIRRGDDYTSGQTVLETWTNLSLDPNQNNYIAFVIGDQKETVRQEGGETYLQISGSYPNNSNYVRVAGVFTPTPNYLNPTGQAYAQYTASIPANGSGSANGSFSSATGPLYGCFGVAKLNMYEEIPTIASVATSPTTNIQGIFPADYDIAISLLANADAYVYNSIYTPGLSSQNASSQVGALLSTVQNRGDAIAVVDMVGYNQTIGAASTAAQSYDNSYGATYWPWVQVRSIETGRLHFVPASVIIPAVYEYNDKVSAEWFAPAGLNRGGLPTVIQPERRLTVGQRNNLYSAKVNPIAVFPGQGTVVYGQKTLQARASALDRVNVRRLLIALKGYIGQIAQTLVFEQNTAVTRNKFLSQVNPYLDYVQQRQGLYAFRVVMDETNNTPDVIDRNLLVGAIYLQPTRTAEFIQLDFNILPTGVTFGA